MTTAEIFARLDEIRSLVESHTEVGGVVAIDRERVYIATEFCLREIRSALVQPQNQD